MTATTTKQKGSMAKSGRIPGATFASTGQEEKVSPKEPKQAKPNAKTPKEPKAAKPKPEPKEKHLSQIDAAAKILTGRTKPLTCQELVDIMKERKLWESKNGKTPERTLSAALDREIAAKGKESRFQKVAPGLYLLYGVKYTPAE